MAHEARTEIDEPSGWAAGWTAFAAVMMMIGGAWWFFAGLVALFDEDFYVVTPEYILQFDVTTWGWIHVVLGVVIAIAGLMLLTGAVWARIVGIIVAVVWALVAFSWLPYYPVWGVILLAVSVAVVWALSVRGDDITRF